MSDTFDAIVIGMAPPAKRSREGSPRPGCRSWASTVGWWAASAPTGGQYYCTECVTTATSNRGSEP
jgi:hypothetical protein